MAWFRKKKERPKKPADPPAADATAATADPSDPEAGEASGGIFRRLRRGLTKTRDILTTDIDDIFARNRKFEDLAEELEERLITADVGVRTTLRLMEGLSRRSSGIAGAADLRAALKAEIVSLMAPCKAVERFPAPKPLVIMVVGVNGVGKTTTIGKLAARFAGEGKSTLIAASDTFRAAAVEQLTIWSERAGAEIVKHRENADPAAVAFDGVEAAAARGRDVVLVDTAGRLHTKVNLMEELKKVRRAMAKRISDAPHEVLLVLDATTGQNALSQAKLFHEALGVTGLALTKLDGTARGGIVIGICGELSLPLKWVGVGEGIDDLQRFDPERFAEALFS